VANLVEQLAVLVITIPVVTTIEEFKVVEYFGFEQTIVI
jgi:hypothetical protein